MDSLDADFIEQRRLALQRYLRGLIEHPVLGKDFELAVFLQHEDFERGDSSSTFSKTEKVVVGVMHNLKVRDMDPRISELGRYSEKLRECLLALEDGFNGLNENIGSQISAYKRLRTSLTEFGSNDDQVRDVIITFGVFLDKLGENMEKKLQEEKDLFIAVVKDYVLYSENIDTLVKRYQSKQLQYSNLVDALNQAQEKKALLERETDRILEHHNGRDSKQGGEGGGGGSSNGGVGGRREGKKSLVINTGFASFSSIAKMFTSVDSPEVHRQKIENKIREIDNTTHLVRKTHQSNVDFVDKVVYNMKYFHEKKEIDLRNALKRYATIQDGFYRQSVAAWENMKVGFENM